MKASVFVLCFLATALGGCAGVFNTQAGAYGRVVDARTGAPIAGAAIIAGSAYTAKIYHSSNDGRFSVPQRRSFGIAVMALAPVGNSLFISAPGYASVHKSVPEIPPTGAAASQDIGIIRLKPL